jgi:hypothetical protein
MPEPSQLTIDGRYVPVTHAIRHADGSQTPAMNAAGQYLGANQLFRAPQTMRGQLAIEQDTSMPDTLAELQAAEAAYQDAARILKQREEARNAAIARAAGTMSTRKVAEHVTVSAQRVQQIAAERRAG